MVESPTGAVFRKHHYHLKKTGEASKNADLTLDDKMPVMRVEKWPEHTNGLNN